MVQVGYTTRFGLYGIYTSLGPSALGSVNSVQTFTSWYNLYIYHAKSRLNTPVWGSLRSPNHQTNFVIERTRDLIYLKFVATDFSPKIISSSAGENSGDSA